MLRSIVVISNPVASGVTREIEGRVVAALRRRVRVRLVVRTERPLHAGELARAAVARGDDAIVVLGGDGTMNEVVNGIGAAVPVGVLPGGGTSVLARATGLSRHPVRAAERVADALAEGRERHLSLGILNGRRFAFAAGVGMDAAIVRRVDGAGRENGRRPGDSYFALQVARVMRQRQYRTPRATLEVGGRSERVSFVVAANLHPWSYAGPFALRAAPQVEPEGGLDLIAPRLLRLRDTPSLAVSLLVTGHHTKRAARTIAYYHDVEHATLTCDAPLPAHVDGDDIGDVTEVVFGVDHAGMRIAV